VALWHVDAGGAAIEVEAEDWMAAALGVLRGLVPEGDEAPTFACSLGQLGQIEVHDQASGLRFTVRPRSGPAGWVARRTSTPGGPILLQEDRPYVHCGGPRLEPPMGARPEEEQRTGEIAPAPLQGDREARMRQAIEVLGGTTSAKEAAELTLQLLRTFIPAESGAVLVARPGEDHLDFLALRGPRAEALRRRGLRVPLGEGIAGFVFSTGARLALTDAAADQRHLRAADLASGYRTRSLLAVPVQEAAGHRRWGVLELLNAPGGFAPWHADCMQIFAGVLAERLELGCDRRRRPVGLGA
jgi:hypothetical protein